MRILTIWGAAAALLAVASPAMADDDDRRFVLQNHTSGVVREFAIRTTVWSNNWLANPVRSQTYQNMNFRSPTGPSRCVMMTRIVVNYGTPPGVGERVFEQNVDYCGLSRLHVQDGGLRREGDAAGASAPRAPAAASSFAVGQRVLARFQGGPLYYPATVTMVRGANLTLYYADGDNGTVHASLVKPFDWRIGSRVNCTFAQTPAGAVYPGRITQMTAQGALQIRYDDGDVEWTTTRWCHSQ